MSRDRPARVGQLIQELLGRIQTRGFKDPRITGFLTFTGVKVAPDLKYATVYWSHHGDEKERAAVAEGLASSAGWVKQQIGKELKLRFTPEVKFVFDEAIERGDRIERLLREVKEQDRARDAGADEPVEG